MIIISNSLSISPWTAIHAKASITPDRPLYSSWAMAKVEVIHSHTPTATETHHIRVRSVMDTLKHSPLALEVYAAPPIYTLLFCSQHTRRQLFC